MVDLVCGTLRIKRKSVVVQQAKYIIHWIISSSLNYNDQLILILKMAAIYKNKYSSMKDIQNILQVGDGNLWVKQIL